MDVIETTFKATQLDPARVMRAFAAANNGSFDPYKLTQWRIPSGGSLQWRVGQNKPVDSLQGVLIFHTPARAYWPDAFGSGERRPPSCQSLDGLTGHGDPGGRCVDPTTSQPICPFAFFGTKPGPGGKNQRAPACKDVRMVYVMTPESALPALLVVPGASLTAFRDYMTMLASEHGLFPQEVVTAFTLEEDTNADGIRFSRLVLTCLGLLSVETQRCLEAYVDETRKAGAARLLQAGSPGSTGAVDPLFAETSTSVQPCGPTPVGVTVEEIADDPDDDIADPEVPAGMTD